MEMHLLPIVIVGALLTVLGLTAVAAVEEIRTCKPAAVIKQGRRKIFFQVKGEATLECEAKGDETLKFSWLKDDEELDVKPKPNVDEDEQHLRLKENSGTLKIHQAMEEDAGTYQCKVQNPCGTSLSHKIQLVYSHIEPFPAAKLKTVQLPERHYAVLTCKPPHSVPKAEIKWILQDSGDQEEDGMGDYDISDPSADKEDTFRTVELSRRVTMDYDGNLHIVNVEKGDAQKGRHYVCMAINEELRSYNQGEDKKLIVLDGDNYERAVKLEWHSPSVVTVMEGQTAKFKCIFSANPLPIVTWARQGSMDDERMSQSQDKHEFIIKDVEPGDAGIYVCSAFNDGSDEAHKTHQFRLVVESYPRWKKRPRDAKKGVDDTATLSCQAQGKPAPDIQWFINGLPLENAPPANNRKLMPNNDLVFTKLNQDDSQVIQCNASNIHGYQWADVYLHVEAAKPVIVSKPTEQKVAEKRDVIIPCGVEGKPRPEVRWYKGGQILSDKRYTILENGDLKISSVTTRDTDNYRCIAENRFGSDHGTGSLIVRRKTEINSKPADEFVSYGENVIFTCGAITDKEESERLRYVWLKDGKELDLSNPKVRVVKGQLFINNTSSKDTGDYTCVATNDLDKDQAKAKLEVKAPPDPPTNITIVSCGDMRVELGWEFRDEQSNFSPLQEFVLEYETNHYPDLWQEAARISARQRREEYEMKPWASYSFRVRAKNLLGVSEPSKKTKNQCQSAESRPYRNPNNVKTVGDKTGWLVVEWEPMPLWEHNSKDFYYNVSWQGKGDRVPRSQNITNFKQDRFEVEVGGVYKPYTVSVRAYNSLGESIDAPESVSGSSGEAPPSVVPQNFGLDPNESVTATSAGFMWDPVDTSPENMNGEFQGYKIRYWKEGQMDTTLHEELIIIPENRRRRQALAYGNSDNKIRGKVSNLPSYSKLEADVVVVNTYFSSNGSNIVNLTTPEGTPDKVESLEALYRGSSHFLLEWKPPKEPNGVLTGYELGYQKINGLQVGHIVVHRDDLSASQTRSNIDGLEPGSVYRIYVAARTKIGPGQKYYIDVRTADDNSELAEPTITNVQTSDHEANITFEPSDSPKGQRTASTYYLEYRKIGDHGWEKDSQGATDHFWLTLKELEPATTYEVRVVSVPQDGAKKSSRETRFNTKGAKKASLLSAGWFIGMMVAIAILLLILIIVCIVKRNRGKEYKFPPEKDTVDEGGPGHFNEMAKSDKNGLHSSASFERDPEKVPLEDETDSLEDYGDVDPTKFNEDGSFIGQYGDTKPDAPSQSAMSSIV